MLPNFIVYVSQVKFQMSHFFFLFLDNVVELVGGGSVINGAFPSPEDANIVLWGTVMKDSVSTRGTFFKGTDFPPVPGDFSQSLLLNHTALSASVTLPLIAPLVPKYNLRAHIALRGRVKAPTVTVWIYC